MTWTYSGDPSSSDKDAVRFYCGDTDSAKPQVRDEEINFLLTEYPEPLLAAAMICDGLASKYADRPDVRIDGVSVSGSKLSEAYSGRAAELRRRAMRRVKPFFGGLTVSGKQSLKEDSDAVQPSFERGQFDNPQAVAPWNPYDYAGVVI